MREEISLYYMLGCTPKCTLDGDKHPKIARFKKSVIVNCTGNDNSVFAAESTPRSATIDQKTKTSIHNGRNDCTIAAEKGYFYAQMGAPNSVSGCLFSSALFSFDLCDSFFFTFTKIVWYIGQKKVRLLCCQEMFMILYDQCLTLKINKKK